MKHFLKRLALFLSLLLLASATLVGATIALHRQALPHCTLNEATKAVIVGDSHMMWSIDDANIPGLRNIALNAEGYKYAYLKLVHLLDVQPGIEHIYIGVGAHNFSGYFDEYIHGATFHQFAERYLSVLSFSDYVELVRSAPLDALGLAQGIVQRGLKPGLKGECLLYGTFPAEKKTAVFDPEHMQMRVREQFYPDGKLVPPSDANIAYLERIVELGRTRGARITVLSAPVHPEYARRVPEVYRRMLQRFVKDHGLTRYAFEDLTLSGPHFLPDGDHTNYAGALLVTERFRRYYLEDGQP